MAAGPAPLDVHVGDGKAFADPQIDNVDPPLVYQYDHAAGTINNQVSIQVGEIQVINGILTEEELKKYDVLASHAKQRDGTMAGRAMADALIEPDLIRRIQGLVGINADSCDAEHLVGNSEGSSSSRKLNEDGAMVTVSKLTSPLPMHSDYHKTDESPVMDHVAFISLKDSDSVFVWDNAHKVPLKENSMLIFRGNYTHGIPLTESQRLGW